MCREQVVPMEKLKFTEKATVMSETLNELATEMKTMLSVKDLELDQPLALLGIDSMNIVEIILICQQVYVDVVDYEEIDIDENTTLRELDSQLLSLSE